MRERTILHSCFKEMKSKTFKQSLLTFFDKFDLLTGQTYNENRVVSYCDGIFLMIFIYHQSQLINEFFDLQSRPLQQVHVHDQIQNQLSFCSEGEYSKHLIYEISLRKHDGCVDAVLQAKLQEELVVIYNAKAKQIDVHIVKIVVNMVSKVF